MDTLDFRLLNEFQKDFPRCERPYLAMAEHLESTEGTVLQRLGSLLAGGAISRIGGVFGANRVGASTLAAMAVPPEELESVARRVSAFPAVNHNYEREHRYNLWFVVTARDPGALAASLGSIEAQTGYPLMSLPLLEAFHIDLGFCLAQRTQHRPSPPQGQLVRPLTEAERCLVAQLQEGLPLVSEPYGQIGQRCGCNSAQVLSYIDTWLQEGALKRWGVVVRHHELGYTANAMVVHAVPESEISDLGRRLAKEPAITLCYRRPSLGEAWPYNLFCMVHGKDRASVCESIRDFRTRQGMEHLPWDTLFSRTRFKQTGARYA